MRLLKHIANLWKTIPVEEKGDRRTRWLLTLLSFFLLSSLMIAAFIASLFKADDISLALIDLVKHLSYVFGGTIACYYGVESFFPSSDRPYWNPWSSRKNIDQEPPVRPEEQDAQVD